MKVYYQKVFKHKQPQQDEQKGNAVRMKAEARG